MTLDQLRYFVAAARYEHVIRAARSIPISPSVVSQAIAALEEELGCELFVREKRKIRLSQAGAKLLKLAEELQANVNRIKVEIGEKEAPLSGHYRIGGSIFLVTKVLTLVLTDLQAKYPELTADVHSQPTWTMIDNILAGKLDFGIGFSPTHHPQLETEEIFRGKIEAVASKNHPIFKEKNPTYKALRDFPATMHIPSERINAPRPHPTLKQLKLASHISFGFDNDYAAVENLRHSHNWSFMLDIVVREFEKYLTVIPLPGPPVHYTVEIVRHKSRRWDPAMAEICKCLKEIIVN